MDAQHDTTRPRSLQARLVETVRAYWFLGFTSFGGPGVHVVILKQRFVNHLQWVSPTTFGDLFALGNALPGPGSTQLAFSIALVRNGTLAGFLAFFLWSLPASIAMAGLAAGISRLPEELPEIALAILTGLNAAAVGLIALAAFQLSNSTITDRLTRAIVLISASAGICYHAPWMYPVLVAGGGITAVLWDFKRTIWNKIKPGGRVNRLSTRDVPTPSPIPNQSGFASAPAEAPAPTTPLEVYQLPDLRHEEDAIQVLRANSSASIQNKDVLERKPSSVVQPNHSELRQRNVPVDQPSNDPTTVDQEEAIHTLPIKVATLVFCVFVSLVVTFVVLKSTLNNPSRALSFFTNLLIAGTIICGGGPVVIPLLRGYTVDPGWVSSRDFLIGFAILQAFPGPNFAFSSYLGVLAIPWNPVLGALLGYLGIFTPGILLKLSLLPVYKSWREYAIAKSALRGLNAAAVGLVYTAVWQLFLVGHIYTSAEGSRTSGTLSGPLTADPWWGVVASTSFVATQWFGLPPPVSVLSGSIGGLLRYAVVRS